MDRKLFFFISSPLTSLVNDVAFFPIMVKIFNPKLNTYISLVLATQWPWLFSITINTLFFCILMLTNEFWLKNTQNTLGFWFYRKNQMRPFRTVNFVHYINILHSLESVPSFLKKITIFQWRTGCVEKKLTSLLTILLVIMLTFSLRTLYYLPIEYVHKQLSTHYRNVISTLIDGKILLYPQTPSPSDFWSINSFLAKTHPFILKAAIS